jgi:hypothetical protein
MILPRVPLVDYSSGPRPFSGLNIPYSEEHLLALMRGIRSWTDEAGLSAKQFYTYILEQDVAGKYALNQYLLNPPYTTLEAAGQLPLVWTADKYGIGDLQPANHHGQASGNPFPPNILETHGKSYAGNIVIDCRDALLTILGRLGLDQDWWLRDFKELTWEYNWFGHAMWVAPGEPKYNLTTDHVEALRIWPRAIANVVAGGKPYQIDARRNAPGSSTPTMSPRIPILDGASLVPNNGLIAVLEGCMVYPDSLYLIPGGAVRPAKGGIIDGCKSGDSILVLHSDGTVTYMFGGVERANVAVDQWADGGVKQSALSDPRGIEYHVLSDRDLPYMDVDTGADPLDSSLVIVDGSDLCFATVEYSPLRIVLRARIPIGGDLKGVCLEHPSGFAKEGRPWAWRVLGATGNQIQATEVSWNILAEGNFDSAAGTYQPLSVFHRQGNKAMDVFPLPEMYFKLRMPDLSGRQIVHYYLARNKLHVLLARQDEGLIVKTTNGAVEGTRKQLWTWTLDLPDGSNLDAVPGVFGGLYSPPSFDLASAGSISSVVFPETKTFKLTDGGGPATDRPYTFHQWRVSNLQEDGGEAKWVIQALYWDDAGNSNMDVVDIYFDGGLETTLPSHGGGGFSTGKLSDGWLVNSAPGRFYPDSWSLQDMLDNPGQWVRNDPNLTLWHVQAGDYVTGWSVASRRWQTHKLDDFTGGGSDKKTFSPTDWWATSTLTRIEGNLSVYGVVK